MKKIKLSFILFVLLAFVVSACGGSSGSSNAGGSTGGSGNAGGNAGKTQELTAAFYYSEADPFNEYWNKFAEAVEGNSNVKFERFYNGSLVNAADALSAVKEGTIELSVSNAAAMTGLIPELGNIETLAGYPNDPDKFEALVKEIWPILKELFRENDVELLFFQGAPGTAVVSAEKFFKTPADFEGAKIRTAGRWQTEQFKSLGATPVSIDPGELYIALQNKTVNASLIINTLAISLKLYEVAPKITQLGIPGNGTVYFMNAKVWNSLPEETRKLMDEKGLEVTIESYRYLQGIQNQALESLKANGAEIYHLTDEEQKAIVGKMTTVFEQVKSQGGDKGRQLAEIMAKYRNS